MLNSPPGKKLPPAKKSWTFFYNYCSTNIEQSTRQETINKTGIKKAYCPLQEKCLSENTLYQADISSKKFQTKIYHGISETKFKTRFSNHKKSFNHEKHKNDTQLSNELWNIKASKKEPVLVWKILGQYQPYNVNTKRCLLCLNEKLQIAIYRGNIMLNKRTEIISKCRHKNKYALESYDSMDWDIRCKVSWNYWSFWSLWQPDLL